MSDTPFIGKSYVREVLLNQTAAEWATTPDYKLEAFWTARNSDDGREKTGPGLWGELPYDAPSGQIYNLPTGTPGVLDLIPYNAQTAAVAATASGSTTNQGTPGSTIIVGHKLYDVVASGATGDQINTGNSDSTYAANIANKVTADTASTLCVCVAEVTDLTFTANTPGATGNGIEISGNDPNLMLDTAFTGGADEINVLMAVPAESISGNPAVTVLSDGATVTWDLDISTNAKVTIVGNRTLDVTNVASGDSGTIIVIQGSGGNHTLALPAGSKVVNGGSGAVTLSTGAGDIDILSFLFDGNSYFWNIGLDYTGA